MYIRLFVVLAYATPSPGEFTTTWERTLVKLIRKNWKTENNLIRDIQLSVKCLVVGMIAWSWFNSCHCRVASSLDKTLCNNSLCLKDWSSKLAGKKSKKESTKILKVDNSLEAVIDQPKEQCHRRFFVIEGWRWNQGWRAAWFGRSHFIFSSGAGAR